MADQDVIIGSTTAMCELDEKITRAARANATVLVLGETGTGKELVARAIHGRSSRVSHRFVPVNSVAIPGELLESELFGHERGSFTTAHAKHEGLFRHAHGGTIFLDEIGDMSMSLQAKLLRTLQERTVRPVGSLKEVSLDVRVVAATNQDLAALVRKRTFREDLYYRLRIIVLQLLPLRERREDIPLLIEHFLRKHCSEYGEGNVPKTIRPAVLNVLMKYDWPGNVRELENVILGAACMAPGDVIEPSDIFEMFDEIRECAGALAEPTHVQNPSRTNGSGPVKIKDLLREHIKSVLVQYGGNREKTAAALGITAKTLYNKIDRYQLKEWLIEQGLHTSR